MWGNLVIISPLKNMAIDPYKPELAKRKTVFEIANDQLCEIINDLHYGPESRSQMEQVNEAFNDYKEAGFSLIEWIEQEPEKA